LGDRIRVKPDRSLVEEVNRYFGAEVISAVLSNGPGPGRNSKINHRNNRRSRPG
jgi:hypothetical protein